MTTEQYKGEHTGLDLLKVGSKDVFTDNISKIEGSPMNLPGLESVKPSQKLDDLLLKPYDQTLMRVLTLIRVKISSSLGTI